MTTKSILFLTVFLFAASSLFAADPPEKRTNGLNKSTGVMDAPIVENHVAYHKIGSVWNRVTNYGKAGDDAYDGRTPSCDWPGGSGNSYLYRGSLWLGGTIDDTVHVTMTEDDEWAPLDTVHVFEDGSRAEQETYTRYYDVKAPNASGHFPLGLEVTERTYAWSESFRDDFIIYEYTIKNVGIDTDDDGYPDTPRDIDEFYFAWRMDGDVSKLPDWAAEYRFSNQDDLAGVNSSWSMFELDLFSDWKDILDQMDGDIDQILGPPDSTLMFMWDGDNPGYPAWDGDGAPDDDTFNPGISGSYQTPGFLGFKILKTVPATFKPSSFVTDHIYLSPGTDQEAYDWVMNFQTFETESTPQGIVTAGGVPFPYDYRGFLSLGPIDKLAAGDSVVVTCALGVGADSVNAGVHSLIKLTEIMDVAQLIVDTDYNVVSNTPSNPDIFLENYTEIDISKGVRVMWEKAPSEHPNFLGYRIYRGVRDDVSKIAYQELGPGYFNKADTSAAINWPPDEADQDPALFEFVDTDVTRGNVYFYAVTAVGVDPFFGLNDPSPDVNNATIIPSAQPQETMDLIKVVPNPYIGSASWNNPVPGDGGNWEHRIRFINLPADATIKIFTLDLDYITKIKAGENAIVATGFEAPVNYGIAEWNLITRNDQEAAPGIYIYVVESSVGTKTGKFVIVR